MDAEEREGWARQLHANPLLAVLIEEMKQAALVRWAATSPDQAQEREDCWREFRSVQKIENLIKNTVKGLNE